ncbi:MAG: PEP-CTERM sorting domain-containing protein [Planctomycetia bacterium]|nr:PEP-CTERM sorting domain-containing protein [Planctomycetia bacterium]
MNVSSCRRTDHAGSGRTAARLITASCLALAAFGTSLTPAQAVTIDWVTVGDAGNAAYTASPGYQYGRVDYEYRIGKYEVTIGQYAQFLNAAAKSDPYGLWDSEMQSDRWVAGISRSGSSGAYTYSVMTNGGYSGNRPISYISWFDAARFANWMQNGQGSASTETGAYTLNGAMDGIVPGKNPGASIYIPTENEWFKAAYYKGGGTNAGYWKYATQSNSAPGNTIGGGVNQANYYAGVYGYAVTQSSPASSSQNNYLTDVGAFTNSPSAYGTFDQSGNVWEWNDYTGVEDSSNRGIRGGDWFENDYRVSSAERGSMPASWDDIGYLGFRLASLPQLSVSGSQVYNNTVTGIVTTGSGASPQFTGGFSGSLAVTGGTATLGGSVAGTVTVAAGAATTIASGADLTNAKVSLAPGAILNVARGTHVPIAAGNIGGISISSTSGRVATVLSGSVATDVNILGNFSPIGSFSAAGGNKIIGDVLSFEGTGSATWALQMQYDPAVLGGNEATLAAAGDLFLSWRKPATNTWVNSVDGNTGGTKQFFQRAWQLGDTLGSYGVDVSKHTVWAVVNHNSDFAVTAITAVPEPSTYALALAGMTCVGWQSFRRRRSHGRRRATPLRGRDVHGAGGG